MRNDNDNSVWDEWDNLSEEDLKKLREEFPDLYHAFDRSKHRKWSISDKSRSLQKAALDEADKFLTEHGTEHGNYGSQRSAPHLSMSSAVIYGKVGNADATETGFIVKAYGTNNGIITYIDTYETWAEEYWTNQLSDRSNALVIDGVHYRVKPDSGRPGAGDGYGGQKFKIRMLEDGRVFETRNLWHQGKIPPQMREKMPDNAEFVKTFDINWNDVLY